MGMEIPGIPNTGHPPEHAFPKNETLAGRRNSAIPEQEITTSLDILEKTTTIFNRRLKFDINREINRIIVKVIDGTTDEVIKEIPPEEIQRLVARIREAIGLLVDEKI